MAEIVSRVRFKTATNDKNISIAESMEELQDLGLVLNYEFRKERIVVGDQITLNGNKYIIRSIECYLDDPITSEFPWNFDLICIVEKV